MVFPVKKFKAEFLKNHAYSPSVTSLEAARWGYEQGFKDGMDSEK